MPDRPKIPRPLRRSVEIEAGHRCAIPTCRDTVGLEIHHIVPWAMAQEHSFDNLILLCGRCHSLEMDHKIDRLSMLAYKRNLGLLLGRYGDMERRLLDQFVADFAEQWELPDGRTVHGLRVDSMRDFDFYYLLRDGIIFRPDVGSVRIGGVPVGPQLYVLTTEGHDLVRRLAEGREADEEEGTV